MTIRTVGSRHCSTGGGVKEWRPWNKPPQAKTAAHSVQWSCCPQCKRTNQNVFDFVIKGSVEHAKEWQLLTWSLWPIRAILDIVTKICHEGRFRSQSSCWLFERPLFLSCCLRRKCFFSQLAAKKERHQGISASSTTQEKDTNPQEYRSTKQQFRLPK